MFQVSLLAPADDSVGMQTITEHEQKLASTLSYLAQEPVADPFKPSKKVKPSKQGLRRLVLIVGFLTMVVTAIIHYQPEVVHWLENIASAEPTVVPHSESIAEQTGTSIAVASTREVAGSGTVVASRATTVFSKYEGQITGVSVEPGDIVKLGQILVILDDAGARFALEQATTDRVAADLSLSARAIDLEQARLSVERNEALVAQEATSRQQLEDARMTAELAVNTLAQAGQELARAELSVRIAEEAVRELTVRAPFAGTITRLDARVGDTVLARADSVRESQSLLTITDMTSLVIDADVAESNIAPLSAGVGGQAVLDAFPDQPFAIEVLRLAPIASAEKGTITLRLAISAPPDGTRPNMAARIRISVDKAGETKQ